MTEPGFRGAKPLPDEDRVFIGHQRRIIHEYNRRITAAREQMIRDALVEEGADPAHVSRLYDDRHIQDPSTPPLPEDIMDRVRRRLDAGEFNYPPARYYTQEDQ